MYFTLEKLVICSWNSVNGHRSMWTLVNSDLPIPIHTQSHRFPFNECWSIRVIYKLQDATPNYVPSNLKRHINLYFNPYSLLVSTSITSFGLPNLYFTFPPLAAPANTLVTLCLQLMKVSMMAKSSLHFIFSLGSFPSDVYRRESGRCRTLSFFLTTL